MAAGSDSDRGDSYTGLNEGIWIQDSGMYKFGIQLGIWVWNLQGIFFTTYADINHFQYHCPSSQFLKKLWNVVYVCEYLCQQATIRQQPLQISTTNYTIKTQYWASSWKEPDYHILF